jgi:hypothetical protein
MVFVRRVEQVCHPFDPFNRDASKGRGKARRLKLDCLFQIFFLREKKFEAEEKSKVQGCEEGSDSSPCLPFDSDHVDE